MAYGLGQLLSGYLGDRVSGRRLVALGAVLSCVLNWVTSLGRGVPGLLVPWALNGLAQSMGYAPASRLIANWWGPHERGRAYGILNFAAGFSSVVTFATAMAVLARLSWAWVFRLPVLLLLLGAAVFFVLVRDRPAESAEAAPPSRSGPGAGAVMRDRRFLLACLGFGLANWARLGLLVWVPAHFLGEGWRAGPRGAWVTLALPVGMALGALVAGWLADRLLGGDHAAVAAGFLAAAAAAVLALRLVPVGAPRLGVTLLFLAGFLVFGPFSSFSALAAELGGPRAIGTALGIMNAAGYGTAAIGDVLTGAVIDATGRTASVFVVDAAACLLGAAATWLARRSRGPADRRVA